MTEQSTAGRSAWMRHGGEASPQQRLRDVVTALTRAQRLQLLIDHGCGGLLLGLAFATVAVLVARLAPLPNSPLQLTVASVMVALVAALLVGWYRRPDTLDVVIRADVALRLKQRLSTAWEHMTLRGDAELTERLAAQAVKATLPDRPGLVFPLRVNRWGRFAPVAAIALLLAGTLDLNRMQAQSPRGVDERVVNEGERLSAFAREMQARAARENLSRAAEQAERLERLGARMESGGLSRREALGLLRQSDKSLDDASKEVLARTNWKDIDPLSRGGEASAVASGRNAGEMLERMLSGVPDRNDSSALTRYLDDLARSGVPRRQADEAVKRHHAGDSKELRDILEKLAQIERARREHEELQNARAQVRQAQESLGEARTGIQGGQGIAIDTDEDDDREGDRTGEPGAHRRLAGESSRSASRHGTQGDSSVASERQPATLRPEPVGTGPILKPEGQAREGAELVTQGQVLPRARRPSVENIPMGSEFASQVEAVLSREQYPAHSREFIRRYFLNLSEGTKPPQPPTRGAQ
jgi:hypothetical protein